MKLPFAWLLLASAPAFAQHDHMADEHQHHHHEGSDAHIMASAALVAASFDTMLYVGSYEGALPSVGYMTDRYSLVAAAGAYHIRENGAAYNGLGDASLHAIATLLSTHAFDAGAMMMVSLPTGDEVHGLGMGHTMLMPALHAVWRAAPRLRFKVAAGYSRAVGVEGHHDHGGWPLVSPMLMAEVSWSAAGDVRVTDAVTAGARASGGVPAGEGGANRVIVGGRVGWRASRVDTAFELQAGVAGDPFNVRGVVSTTLSF